MGQGRPRSLVGLRRPAIGTAEVRALGLMPTKIYAASRHPAGAAPVRAKLKAQSSKETTSYKLQSPLGPARGQTICGSQPSQPSHLPDPSSASTWVPMCRASCTLLRHGMPIGAWHVGTSLELWTWNFEFACPVHCASQFIGDHLLSTRGVFSPNGRKASTRKCSIRTLLALTKKMRSLKPLSNSHSTANSPGSLS